VTAKTAETCGRCQLNVQCSEVVFALTINTDVALLSIRFLKPNTKYQTLTACSTVSTDSSSSTALFETVDVWNSLELSIVISYVISLRGIEGGPTQSAVRWHCKGPFRYGIRRVDRRVTVIGIWIFVGSCYVDLRIGNKD
jgi:hypothetical protein